MKTEKPWGHEVLIGKTEGYAGKVLYVKAGCRTSKQYHEKKIETVHLYSGQAQIYIQSNGVVSYCRMWEGNTQEIKAGEIHRLEAITDCVFFEVSTPELEDVVRLEDDYGRVKE